MPNVAVRSKGIAHLHQMDLLSLHAQVNGALAAGQTTAQHDHGILDLVLFQIVVIDDHHVFPVNSGKWRHDGAGPHRENQGIGLFCGHVLGSDRRIQADIHPFVPGLAFQRQAQLIHFVLERNGLFALQDAACAVGFLAQDDLVSTLGGRDGGLQARHAATGDQHFLPARGRRHLHSFQFPADERIHGAAAGERGGTLGHAGEAAQAADDPVLLARGHLLRQERISQQFPGHVDDVGLALPQNPFHLGGIVQGADRGDGLGDVLLDFGGEVDVGAVVGEHGQVGVEESELVGAGGNVNQVHEVFYSLRDPAAFLDTVSTIKKFAAAHADFDREAGADTGAYGLQDLAREADAVLEAPAVLVGAVVEVRREELVQQPAMTGMDHDHLVTGAFGQYGSLAVTFYDIGNLFLRKPLDRPAIGTDPVTRAPLVQRGLLVLVGHVGAGVLAGVRELDARDGSVAADAVRHESMGGQAAGRLEVQVQHVAAVRFGMYDQFAHRHGRRAALGAKLVESLDTGSGTAVGSDVRRAHRRREHPVPENDAAELDGAVQQRERISLHTVGLTCFLRAGPDRSGRLP